MLKALELYGFKSFADRARFEFPPGITVIVGPNGSGKSNIVDAIKWVLGEQSAKSLRGKDMADVIFKGSGTAGRKPMNAAEATLVFDNADRRLPIDAPEVHITRRVYRSGEGEYLINRQPARLKDIRDMFRGTGVAGDAYSLIEQGKVDRLLQASAKDRRAIFEEAAGISRFKAKKVEAQRRLERVDQNLLRLSDIVEEVENRLRAVRSQAGKARRYREYSQRLQELRTQIALVDWRRLTDELAGHDGRLKTLSGEQQSAEAELQRVEAAQLALETAALTADEELRNLENRLGFTAQEITQHRTLADHERDRAAELDEEIRLHRRNLWSVSDRAGDLRERLKSTEAEASQAGAQLASATEDLTARERQIVQATAASDATRQQLEIHQTALVEILQTQAGLISQLEGAQRQRAAAQASCATSEQEIAELAVAQDKLAREFQAMQNQAASLVDALAANQADLESAQKELAENRGLHASRADDLAQLHSRRSGVAERAGILEEFERTLEGVGAGVKQLLAQAGDTTRQKSDDSVWSHVRGVVADFVQADVEHAAAIDAALSDTATSLVIDGGIDEARQVVRAAGELAGRIHLLPLGASYDDDAAADRPEISLPIDQAIIGRAHELVRCPEQYRLLARTLLSDAVVVRTLDDALRLRPLAPNVARWVTLSGEVLEAGGAMSLGPRHSATSLVSRRSQLRAARLDLAVLDQQIVDAQRETQHLRLEIDRHEERASRLLDAGRTLEQQIAKLQLALDSVSHTQTQHAARQSGLQRSLDKTKRELDGFAGQIERLSSELAAAERQLEAARGRVAVSQQQLAAAEQRRQNAASDVTAAKVKVARCEQQVESLRLRLAQFHDDQRDRQRAISQVQQQLAQAEDRMQASQVASLFASSAASRLLLVKESLQQQKSEVARDRDRIKQERSAWTAELAALRRRTEALRDQQHQTQLAAEQVRHKLQTLADRLREDYGLELAELTTEPTPQEAQERAATEAEIESLRRKINQLGAVNLDALEELDDLEARYATLAAQHKDLTEAKQSLERIIQKINGDSRRLFLETLEAIRVNFQALYRKAFGGGKADVMLEEGVDVLDAGVEIIATPPGKPSFNNSLLSGGEKALTAVALLLAIFQFRPSPFCVLDEVDAPFDEANIGRFIDVLKDFLGWTRFVIVTHSKKTMTAATTLYGVTMQESGVSKRVSVRFDDVTDDGHIRSEALDRSQGDDAPAMERGVA